MQRTVRAQTWTATIMCLIAVFSVVQTSGPFSSLVFADNILSIQLSLAQGNNEPTSATGTVEINLENGDVEIELEDATPDSIYTSAFVSYSSSIALGALTTGGEGDGKLDAHLSPGAYVGYFALTRLEALQLSSADVSFTIGATVSTLVTTTSTSSQTTITETGSTTETQSGTTTSETETSNIVTGAGTLQIEFQVEPAFKSIAASSFAKFNIRIRPTVTASILLVARGVPDHSVAIFTPNMGVADPQFHSTMTIVTSADTKPGLYGITVLALVNGHEFNAQVALEVTGSTITNQTTSTISISAGPALSLNLFSDKRHYEPNATVSFQGHVTDETGNAVADAMVSMQVDGPTGAEIVFVTSLETDAAGVFRVSFRLPSNATIGTYTAFASATKSGYDGATSHTTFVVGSSSTPSVIIRVVYAGDSAGNPSGVFSAGQTVVIWVTVENIGPTFQGVVWVQIRNPNGIPISIQFRISSLNSGETVKDGFGFTFLSKPTPGVYTVNALVSDKMISQGGTFLASAETQFAVTG